MLLFLLLFFFALSFFISLCFAVVVVVVFFVFLYFSLVCCWSLPPLFSFFFEGLFFSIFASVCMFLFFSFLQEGGRGRGKGRVEWVCRVGPGGGGRGLWRRAMGKVARPPWGERWSIRVPYRTVCCPDAFRCFRLPIAATPPRRHAHTRTPPRHTHGRVSFIQKEGNGRERCWFLSWGVFCCWCLAFFFFLETLLLIVWLRLFFSSSCIFVLFLTRETSNNAVSRRAGYRRCTRGIGWDDRWESGLGIACIVGAVYRWCSKHIARVRGGIIAPVCLPVLGFSL